MQNIIKTITQRYHYLAAKLFNHFSPKLQSLNPIHPFHLTFIHIHPMTSFLQQSKSTLTLLMGVIIGGIIGLLFGEQATVLEPLGELFLNLMFVIIVPLVFLSISAAIASMNHMARLGHIMRTVFFVFVSTALLAALIGYVGVSLYDPFQGLDAKIMLANLPPPPEANATSLGQLLVNTLTVSDFLKLFTKSSLLALIVFAVLLGLATAMAGEQGKPVAALLQSGNAVILKMIGLIMKVAPIGLGAYFAATVGHLGPQIVHGYVHAFVLYLILTVVYFFGANSLYAFIAGGRLGLTTFWGHVLTPAMTAIATSSSAACIPINLIAAKKMGVPDDIAKTVIPLGANTHKDGSVIGGIIKIAFLMALFQQDISQPTTMLAMIAVAFLVGAVMGAIPGGGSAAELMICAMFGFSPEMVGTIMIISTIIDIPATLLNSTGNTVCAMLVTRFVEGKDWLKRQMAES
jgi:Na+/H+-dicarboxylate symporter